jgi:hypothetical protein
MAIITTPLMPGEYVAGKGKAMEFTRLVKETIVRQGISGWTKTVQQTRTPNDPQTAAQLCIRALARFIFREWHNLTDEQRLYWKLSNPDEELEVCAYYLQTQMARWVQFKAPSQDPEAAEESTPIAISNHQYTAGKRFATLSLTPGSSLSIFGVIILRSTSTIATPNYTQAIILLPLKTADTILYTDSPLPRGTHHYRAAIFNTDGTMGPVLADDTVTVT